MKKEIEVLPVTSDEAVRILGSMKIEELEQLLDEIKILRRNKSLNDAIMLAHERYLKTPIVVLE